MRFLGEWFRIDHAGMVLPNDLYVRDLYLAESLVRGGRSGVLPLWNGFANSFRDTSIINGGASSGYDTAESGVVKTGYLTWGTDTHTGTSGSPGTWVSRTFALPNGQQISHLGCAVQSAVNVTLKILLENSSTNYNVVVSETFAHPGGGWADFEISSAFAVPGSGTYRVGFYVASSVVWFRSGSAGSSSYNAGNVTGSGQTISSNSAIILTRGRVLADMNLITNGQTLNDVPASSDAFLLVDDVDGMSLNTDVVVSISRNGGTNWSTGVLRNLGNVGALRLWHVVGVNLSGQPSGSSLALRIQTDNGKTVKIHGVSAYGRK